jgi:hypothetical protein
MHETVTQRIAAVILPAMLVIAAGIQASSGRDLYPQRRGSDS